jgi:hypothetical protein
MIGLKTIGLIAAVGGAVLAAGCSPATNSKCPTLAVAADVGKAAPGTATFTLTPVADGLTYNWSVSAGSITEGQGTPAIVVADPTPGDTVTATVEVGGRDASCAAASNTASGTAKMP